MGFWSSVLNVVRASDGGTLASASPTNVNESRMFGDNDAWAMAPRAEARTADEAAKAMAVSFCCSFIAVIMGSLPREMRDSAGKVVEGGELLSVLDEAPNRLQTGDEFWSSLLYRAALAGVAYAEPVESAMGIEIWPLDPARLSVDWEDRNFTLTYLPERGPLKYFNPVDVFWVAGLADSTSRPLTPWKMAKGSIDFALSLEKQGRDFFTNGARFPGFLSAAGALTDEQIERLKAGVAKWRTGGIPVLEEGLDFKNGSSTNSDAELTELIKQRTMELARHWHIPVSIAGDAGEGKANHEQGALDLVKYVVRPWARRIEQAVRQRLMTPDQRKKLWFKLNLDGLLRGDSATQFRNAVLGRTAGSHSINAVRAWFGEPRIEEPWADDPRTPLNSNRAADTASGGQTAPQDQQMAEVAAVRETLALAGIEQAQIDEMFPIAEMETV